MVVGDSASSLRDQLRHPNIGPAPVQLAIADRQHRSRRNLPSPPGKNFRQYFNALQILRTHRFQAHPCRTFQLGREVTFLLGSFASTPLDEGFRERIDTLFREWEQGFAAALALGQSKGQVRPDLDPEATAMFIVAALEGCFGLAKSSRKMDVILARLNAVSSHLESLRTKKR